MQWAHSTLLKQEVSWDGIAAEAKNLMTDEFDLDHWPQLTEAMVPRKVGSRNPLARVQTEQMVVSLLDLKRWEERVEILIASY